MYVLNIGEKRRKKKMDKNLLPSFLQKKSEDMSSLRSTVGIGNGYGFLRKQEHEAFKQKELDNKMQKFHQFLRKRKQCKEDTPLLLITNFAGGAYALFTEEDVDLFQEFLSQLVDHYYLPFNENLPENFTFFVDMDNKVEVFLTPEQIMKDVLLAMRVVSEHFPGLSTITAIVSTSDKCVWNKAEENFVRKTGVHIIFKEICVTSPIARQLANCISYKMSQDNPLRAKVTDTQPYSGKYACLRINRCHKTQVCRFCDGEDDEEFFGIPKSCTKCLNRKKIMENATYKLFQECVLQRNGSKGTIELKFETSSLAIEYEKNNSLKCVRDMSLFHRPVHGVDYDKRGITKGFIIPPNHPDFSKALSEVSSSTKPSRKRGRPSNTSFPGQKNVMRAHKNYKGAKYPIENESTIRKINTIIRDAFSSQLVHSHLQDFSCIVKAPKEGQPGDVTLISIFAIIKGVSKSSPCMMKSIRAQAGEATANEHNSNRNYVQVDMLRGVVSYRCFNKDCKDKIADLEKDNTKPHYNSFFKSLSDVADKDDVDMIKKDLIHLYYFNMAKKNTIIKQDILKSHSTEDLKMLLNIPLV